MPGTITRFSAKTCEQLKHYVYLYIDPRNGRPFYIGKGCRNRCFSHLKSKTQSDKTATIGELQKLGIRPRIELLKYGLTESQALLVEATAIDLLEVGNLTNTVRGFGSRVGSRGTVEQVAAQLDAPDVKITDPVILITINKLFHHDMTLQELYDATRSAWKLGSKRETAEYALSIYRGVVREVFRIEAWVPGGSTMKSRDTEGRPNPRYDRWEFVGQVAEDPVRRRYLNRSVRHLVKPGAQNPIQYVKC